MASKKDASITGGVRHKHQFIAIQENIELIKKWTMAFLSGSCVISKVLERFTIDKLIRVVK